MEKNLEKCICGLNSQLIPNHLKKILNENLCCNSIAISKCEYVIVKDNLRICRYLKSKIEYQIIEN